ncbi:protein daughter of sevenless [Caerostris extrusa]|uniref:Protein daughter of sevenless n=1 Tax=Caerostris extrusa TaxID=172846 RepID=A0AAV4XMT7_CAEEX|nr:protein daughter of sevenless [Caerostris extrusa]
MVGLLSHLLRKGLLSRNGDRDGLFLRHSGLLPGQFILEYFTDSSCKKLKGKIDLDQCEQIDAGLPVDSKVAGYQYMFDIRTPKGLTIF